MITVKQFIDFFQIHQIVFNFFKCNEKPVYEIFLELINKKSEIISNCYSAM